MAYLVYFTLLLFVEESVSIVCDDGWVLGWSGQPDLCYLFVNSSQLDWYQASSACQAHGARLVFFDSSQELSWFKSKILDHWSYAYWTDLNIPPFSMGLLLQNGQWIWGRHRAVDPTLLKTFWNASPASPTRPLCMGINMQGRFEDLDCDSKQRYACSIEWTGDGSCPFEWLVTDRGCLRFSEPGEPLLTWSQAKDKCWRLDQSDAAHLLSIANVEVATVVNRVLSSLNATTHVYWTAMVTKGFDLVWDNGAQYDPSVIHWATEPDHVAFQENCGAIRFSGKFSDRNCSTPLNYACKK